MISPVQPTKPYNPVKKAAKVATGVVVTTGLVAAGLAVGAKKGVFNPGNNKYLNVAKKYMKQAGEFIDTNVGKVAKKVKSYKINDRIVNSKAYKTVKSGLSSAGKKIKECDLKGKFTNVKDSVSNFFERHIHPEKFN